MVQSCQRTSSGHSGHREAKPATAGAVLIEQLLRPGNGHVVEAGTRVARRCSDHVGELVEPVTCDAVRMVYLRREALLADDLQYVALSPSTDDGPRVVGAS